MSHSPDGPRPPLPQATTQATPPPSTATTHGESPSATMLEALRQEIDAGLADSDRDITAVERFGQRFVVKYERPARGKALRALLSAAGCWLLFREWPSPRKLQVGGVHHEAARLRSLCLDRERVPRVYLETADYIVMEHCGHTVEGLLGDVPPAERPALVAAVMEDLGRFHRNGHWHGGAQVRNVTRKNGLLYRIDFEENIGAALSLPTAQAYDVLLTFTSLIDCFRDDRPFGVRLLRNYLSTVPQVAEPLRRIARWLTIAQRIEPHLTKRWQRNPDVRRAVAFSFILNEALKSGAPA